MRRTLLLLMLLLSLFVSGCQTMAGFGRDLQNAGSWLERQSD